MTFPPATARVNSSNLNQATAQAIADAKKAADYMNATAPGSPAAQQANRAYLETRRLASRANATHDPTVAWQAVQASQASVNYINNVATGRSPNTSSPYDSNGNVYSYYNSSFDTGKIPSTDAPRIKEISEQELQYCSASDRIGNIQAFGAGDYGAEALGKAWSSVVTWAKSDKGQKILMTVGSVAEIAGGIAITVATGGSAGILITAASAALVGGGASSLIGSYATEALGGNFKTGWAGGQISGLLTGFGIGTGVYEFTSSALKLGASVSDFVKGFGSIVGFSGAGGYAGGYISSIYMQKKETGVVDIEVAHQQGQTSGIIAAMSWPFSVVSSALSDVGETVTSIIVSLTQEGIFDSSGYYAGATN